MKKFLCLIITAVIALTMVGCGNRQLFDTTYTYNKAVVCLPNGEVVSGNVDSWRDYEDGDQIQVVINGTVYLVHSSNIVLIKD